MLIHLIPHLSFVMPCFLSSSEASLGSELIIFSRRSILVAGFSTSEASKVLRQSVQSEDRLIMRPRLNHLVPILTSMTTGSTMPSKRLDMTR